MKTVDPKVSEVMAGLARRNHKKTGKRKLRERLRKASLARWAKARAKKEV